MLTKENFLIKFLKKIYRNLVVVGRPLTIHTEAIAIDNLWEIVKQKAKTGKIHKWYVITPTNYDFFKVYFNLKIPKQEFSKKLKSRYLWLLEHNQKLELHVHLNPIMNISYKEQEKLIEEAYKWFVKNLKIKPKEFVPGWWMSNEDTKKILKGFNLRLIKFEEYRTMHDFDWAEIK